MNNEHEAGDDTERTHNLADVAALLVEKAWVHSQAEHWLTLIMGDLELETNRGGDVALREIVSYMTATAADVACAGARLGYYLALTESMSTVSWEAWMQAARRRMAEQSCSWDNHLRDLEYTLDHLLTNLRKDRIARGKTR